MDPARGGEEVEEEGDGEEGGEDDEAFGVLLRRRRRFRWGGRGGGEGVHTRVELGSVGREVSGGSPGLDLEVRQVHRRLTQHWARKFAAGFSEKMLAFYQSDSIIW